MTELLANHVNGRWHTGNGKGSTLLDPVLGTELVRVDSSGIDLPAAFAYARDTGGAALRAMTYAQRAKLLADIAGVLREQRLRVHDARIATFGERAEDLLLVSDEHDALLSPERCAQLRETLLAVLDGD